MFNFLGGRDNGQIAERPFVADRLTSLFDQAANRLAGLRPRLLTEMLEGLFQALDVVFGLFQVVANGVAELLGIGGLRHFRKCANEMFLGIVQIPQMIYEDFVQSIQSHDEPSFVLVRFEGTAHSMDRGRKEVLPRIAFLWVRPRWLFDRHRFLHGSLGRPGEFHPEPLTQ